jgi:hypothetical protein
MDLMAIYVIAYRTIEIDEAINEVINLLMGVQTNLTDYLICKISQEIMRDGLGSHNLI